MTGLAPVQLYIWQVWDLHKSVTNTGLHTGLAPAQVYICQVWLLHRSAYDRSSTYTPGTSTVLAPALCHSPVLPRPSVGVIHDTCVCSATSVSVFTTVVNAGSSDSIFLPCPVSLVHKTLLVKYYYCTTHHSMCTRSLQEQSDHASDRSFIWPSKRNTNNTAGNNIYKLVI